MTTKAQLRRTALGLPETEQGTQAGRPAFSVCGEVFASVTEDGAAELRLPEAAVRAAVARCPTAEAVVEDGAVVGVRVPLSDVDGMHLNAMVREAWKHRAPGPLAADLEASERADPAEGDLPAAIGRPATQALYQEGVKTLDQVAERTAAELLALHGVGPKAVRLLRAALEQEGKSMRD